MKVGLYLAIDLNLASKFSMAEKDKQEWERIFYQC